MTGGVLLSLTRESCSQQQHIWHCIFSLSSPPPLFFFSSKKSVPLRSLTGNSELIPHPCRLQVLVVTALDFPVILPFIVTASPLVRGMSQGMVFPLDPLMVNVPVCLCPMA